MLPPSASPLKTKPAALGASLRGRLVKRDSVHAAIELFCRFPAPCSELVPPGSIRPNRRRILFEEIARATRRVVRISRLADRRTRVERVVLIARRAATRPRAASAP